MTTNKMPDEIYLQGYITSNTNTHGDIVGNIFKEKAMVEDYDGDLNDPVRYVRADLAVPSPLGDDICEGEMKCAKCNFILIRKTLHVQSGNIGMGNNKTEPCPNGCGNLWPRTWREVAHETGERLEALFAENLELKAAASTQAPAPKAAEDESHIDWRGLDNILRGMRCRNEQGSMHLTNWIADNRKTASPPSTLPPAPKAAEDFKPATGNEYITPACKHEKGQYCVWCVGGKKDPREIGLDPVKIQRQRERDKVALETILTTAHAQLNTPTPPNAALKKKVDAKFIAKLAGWSYHTMDANDTAGFQKVADYINALRNTTKE